MKRKTVFKKGPLAIFWEALLAVLFTLAVAVIIAVGLAQAAEGSRAEGLRLLEEGIRRAVNESYALEGRYPDSIGYIEEHYGVIIDRGRYAVRYSAVADNIYPDIFVYDIRNS
jgi:hypothetical protein